MILFLHFNNSLRPPTTVVIIVSVQGRFYVGAGAIAPNPTGGHPSPSSHSVLDSSAFGACPLVPRFGGETAPIPKYVRAKPPPCLCVYQALIQTMRGLSVYAQFNVSVVISEKSFQAINSLGPTTKHNK